MAVLVTVALVAGVLIGFLVITQSDDDVVPAPTPTTTEPSPSATTSTTSQPPSPEEAAIAAAEAVYGDYLRVSDEITTAGDGDVSALETVAIGEALTQAQVAAENYQLAGIRRVGGVELAALTASGVTLTSDPPEVVLDACLDVSETDLIGPDGESVTSPDDPDRLAATAFVREYPERGGWRVARIVAEGQPC
jgi:cytoskeletal protein RodZ